MKRFPTRRHVTIATLTAMVVALATFLMPASPASAVICCTGGGGGSIGCYAASCDGKDPQQMGCGADARTLAYLTPAGGGIAVELRVSNACWAAWARNDSGSYQQAYGVYGAYTSSGPDVIWEPTNSTAWSPMISFNFWVRACAEEYATGGKMDCTARY